MLGPIVDEAHRPAYSVKVGKSVLLSNVNGAPHNPNSPDIGTLVVCSQSSMLPMNIFNVAVLL